jgi:penicillin-binding protein 1A
MTERALERRNWVLGQMLENGFITEAEHAEAVAAPLGTVPRQTPRSSASAAISSRRFAAS